MGEIKITNGVLDYYDLEDKIQLTMQRHVYNSSNYKLALKELENYHSEVIKFFRNSYSYSPWYNNEYSITFFEILSNLHHAIGIIYTYLKNSDLACDYALSSSILTTSTGREYQTKIDSLGSLMKKAVSEEHFGTLLNLDTNKFLKDRSIKSNEAKFKWFYENTTGGVKK